MGRRRWTQEELDKVVMLRQSGASWLKIQKETGIHRRTVKRAYEEWERSQSVKELKQARKEVAQQEFQTHMDSLIRLASSLLANLGVSPSITDMEKNSEQLFSWLWQQDLLKRYISPETRMNFYTMGEKQTYYPVDLQSYHREQELLFDSLKVHTREQVRWEDILDKRWKEARDNCARIVPKLQKQTNEVVNNYLVQESKSNLLVRIKEESAEREKAVEQMVRAVLTAIWQGILEDRPGQNLVLFIKNGDQGIVKARNEIFLTFNDTSLAEKVTHLCNLAVNNLSKEDIVTQLDLEVRKLKKTTDELREMLNPVRLRPMILRTQCELCPA